MDAAVASPRLSIFRHLALGSFWLGIYFVITPVYTILLQLQVSESVPRGSQATMTGLATFLGGLLALLLPPLVGFLSDRLNTPWGRRKPIMVAGVLGVVVALLILWSARSYPPLLLGFVLLVATINVAGAAYVAVIPDTVQGGETGRASGVLGFMVQAGSVLALLATFLMSKAGHIRMTYLILIAVLVLALLPCFWAMGGREGGKPAEGGRTFSLREFLKPLWKGDFAWAVATRFLTVSGLFMILPFLLFAFRDLHHVRDAARFTTLFELLLTGVAIPFAIICGWLSDTYGRKRFVYLSGVITCSVLLVFVLFPTLPRGVVLALGMVYGIGFGAYTAVDWALALDTLPDRANPAKDLGLFHVADALPRVLIPLFAGAILDAVNTFSPNLGYRAIFVASIVLYAAGAILVSRIKSVR